MSTELRRLAAEDTDLAAIAAQLNAADWEASIKDFSEKSLRNFLTIEGNFYLLAYIDDKIAGGLHGYTHLHPTGVTYLYVDEVDTMVKYRRHGVATAMMREAFIIGRQAGVDELWLGADESNPIAQTFYKTLEPTEIEPGTIYSWKLN